MLGLEDEVAVLKKRVRELEEALADEMLARPGRRVFAAGSAGDIVTIKAGTRVRRENSVVVWRPLERGLTGRTRSLSLSKLAEPVEAR